MKYVILIHSNPQPWGHPTGDYVAENQALPQEQRDQMNKEFDALLQQMQASGELVGGEALGDPATSRLYRWNGGESLATDGPYSESKERCSPRPRSGPRTGCRTTHVVGWCGLLPADSSIRCAANRHGHSGRRLSGPDSQPTRSTPRPPTRTWRPWTATRWSCCCCAAIRR